MLLQSLRFIFRHAVTRGLEKEGFGFLGYFGWKEPEPTRKRVEGVRRGSPGGRLGGVAYQFLCKGSVREDSGSAACLLQQRLQSEFSFPA